ncbi:MAG: hypothetical protein ACLQMO_09330 [Acidobacteriaceae bacterium]
MMQIEAGQIELQSRQPLAEQPAPIRGTQSFLRTIAECWKKPSLLGLELLWRWGFGIPALAILGWEAFKILSSVSLAQTGIAQFSLIDTVTAAQILSATADVLLPPIREVARWLLPVLAVSWALASGFGRSLVLRRYDPTLRFAPWLMVGLQFLRIVVLGSSVALWFVCLHWAAWSSLGGTSPDLVFYFIKAIALSFAIFFFWALVSWVFSIAPLLALLEGTGMRASLRNSLRFGQGSLRGLRSKLVEINLVLGIVKAALMVLAMVFCATPVPFKEEINGTSLYVWWALVTVWYCVASDFFQVARIIGFMELWRDANHEPQRSEISSTVATTTT